MSEYFVFAVALGLPAYIVAVVARRSRQLRESRKRAADCLALALSDTYGTYAAGTDTNSDGNDDGGTLGTTGRRSGRRAIHRDNGGPGPRSYAARRNIRSSNETALA